MFMISSKNLGKSHKMNDFKLTEAQIGRFRIFYDSRLGSVEKSLDSISFNYGVFDHLARSTPHNHGNYFSFSFDPKNQLYSFYSDPESLCPFSVFIADQDYIILNDIVLLQLLCNYLHIDHEMTQFFIENGFLPSGKTLFKLLIFNTKGHLYEIDQRCKLVVTKRVIMNKQAPIINYSDAFLEVLKRSLSRIMNSTRPTHMLLSGGSDSRIILGCLETDKLSELTFQSINGWNPNSKHDITVASLLVKRLKLRHEIITNRPVFIQDQPTINTFLNLARLENLTLTGFHGTEMLGSGINTFFRHNLDLPDNEEHDLVLHSLSTSFIASFYEGSLGPLFHFPYLLLSRGYISPFRDSEVVHFIRQLPSQLRQHYGLYQEIFRGRLRHLADIPFFSRMTHESCEWASVGNAIPVPHKNPDYYLEPVLDRVFEFMDKEKFLNLGKEERFRLLKVIEMQTFLELKS